MTVASKQALARDLVAACAAAGTRHLFGIPGGGSNLDVVGAAEEFDIRFVLTHTENAAAIMAGVAGELTGAPGLCLVTRGPGAASAVNGIAQAELDRQPVILITDNVAASEQERISHQRIDQHALFAPITRASVVLTGVDDENPVALTGRGIGLQPGPVHVDVDPSARPVHHTELSPSSAIELDDAARTLLESASHPVLIVGVGALDGGPVRQSRLAAALARLGSRTNIPVLCTYKARGMVADSSGHSAGVMTGATIESPVLDAADLIIGIGLDPVELIPGPWHYEAPVMMLGAWTITDSTFFGTRLASELAGDLVALVDQAADFLASAWTVGAGATFRQTAQAELIAAVQRPAQGLTPVEVVTTAREVAPTSTIATVDAGAHMLAAMALWDVEGPGELLISSGLATMGFSLPAAVAAALVRPDSRIVCFTGDGGIGMALAELETLVRLRLNVTVIVFNDSQLSLIAAKQLPSGHGGANAVIYAPMSFAGIAEACGMPAERCSTPSAFRAATTRSFEREGPTLLDVIVDPTSYSALLDAVRAPRH